MGTNTPHRDRGRRSRVAARALSSRVRTMLLTVNTIICPARARSSCFKLFSRPTRQLQGTAIFTTKRLRNFFSPLPIQPNTPRK